ncbi:MAG TPA: hypothetical protein VFF26_12180 [Gallionella sp.]|nr:hypothetical protein [Gallionella sp.]
MNKPNKFANKISFAFLSMLVGAYLLLALINLKDENLNTEVQALFSALPQIEAGVNGYFAWIGIMGPEKEDPHVWGATLVPRSACQ